jgi:pyrimidine operon attenuation protein / uracil phosphoribosyltransferase
MLEFARPTTAPTPQMRDPLTLKFTTKFTTPFSPPPVEPSVRSIPHSYSEPMPPEVVEILSPEELRRTINRLASQIVERAGDLTQLVLIGIYTRGVPIAELLAKQIEVLEQVKVPVGAIDITFYRDDLDQIDLRTPEKTNIPGDLSGKTVVLVDDVIYKGRTIRAALNAIHDYGRPDAVRLAVLIDRGHREVPVHPDFTGRELPTAREESVKVYLQALDGRDGVELMTRPG